MIEKAVAELKKGEAAALAKFNAGEAGFKDRDLYVFCYEMSTGKFTAHVNKALIGTDVKALKEKDGSPLGEKCSTPRKRGRSPPSPTTSRSRAPRPVPKESSYVTRVGNQGCGVGYYK